MSFVVPVISYFIDSPSFIILVSSICQKTDGIGYLRSVSEAGYDIIGKKMTLLGAGGAAAAICVQAALDGVSSIDLFKRR